MSDCGNWLIVTAHKDCRDNLIYFAPLKAGVPISNNLPLTQVVDKLEADYDVSKKSPSLSTIFLKMFIYFIILLLSHIFSVYN